MNWLAHVFLSPPDVEFRLGNMLADLVKGRDRVGQSERFLLGAACHQSIDGYTDSHPVVHRSRGRIGAEWGHLTGILVDIFYDYYLANDWSTYSPQPLEDFAAEVYGQVRDFATRFPGEAGHSLERLVTLDVLVAYRSHEGMTEALRRVSIRLTERLGRPFDLRPALGEMIRNHDGLRDDFAEFFPQLREHVERWLLEHAA